MIIPDTTPNDNRTVETCNRLYVGFSVPSSPPTSGTGQPDRAARRLRRLELTNGYGPDGKRCFRTAGATHRLAAARRGRPARPGDRQRRLVSFYSRGGDPGEFAHPDPADTYDYFDRLGSIVALGNPDGSLINGRYDLPAWGGQAAGYTATAWGTTCGSRLPRGGPRSNPAALLRAGALVSGGGTGVVVARAAAFPHRGCGQQQSPGG